MARRFEVQVTGLEDCSRTGRALIFHGTNKSGSLTLTNVLFHAYYAAGRANQFFSSYRGIPPEVKRLRRIIDHSTGHSFFSGHALYDSVPRDPERRVYVTQFRNPLPRARSCHQWLKDKYDLDLSFESWLVGTRGLAHSQVVQLALGFGPDAPDWRDLSGQELLDRAIANIERDVAWFGIAEYFEESAFTFAALCGLPSIGRWRRDPRNENRTLVTEWPQHEIDMVREVCTWDFQLYEWALDRFEKSLGELRFGPELDNYRRAGRGQYKDRLRPDGQPVEGALVRTTDGWADLPEISAEPSAGPLWRQRRPGSTALDPHRG